MALWVVLGLVGIGVLVSFFVMIASRRQTPAVVQTFDQDKLEQVQALKRKAEQHFRNAMRAMSDDREPDRVRETRAALKMLNEAGELFMELTKPYRDEDGELPPKYQGHEEILGQIQNLRHDIGKISPIDD